MIDAGAPQAVLYTGTLCHLCQQGRDTVYSVLPSGIKLREINIDGHPSYKERYGVSIPVFAIVDDRDQVMMEKPWPFSAGQIKKLLSRYFKY